MRALIFANGKLNHPPESIFSQQPDDLVIAADGGLVNSTVMGITPQIVIGDFDSLDAHELSLVQANGVQVVKHPARKDFTDLELAIEHAVEAGASEILILAALGNRWDQTLANLFLIAAERFGTAQIRLLDGNQEIYLLRGGETLHLRGRAGDTVSLIPLGSHASSVTTQGLEYPLHADTLYFGSTRGISNVLIANECSVHMREGLLLVTQIHT